MTQTPDVAVPAHQRALPHCRQSIRLSDHRATGSAQSPHFRLWTRNFDRARIGYGSRRMNSTLALPCSPSAPARSAPYPKVRARRGALFRQSPPQSAHPAHAGRGWAAFLPGTWATPEHHMPETGALCMRCRVPPGGSAAGCRHRRRVCLPLLHPDRCGDDRTLRPAVAGSADRRKPGTPGVAR